MKTVPTYAFAAGVLSIVLILVVPLPPWLLDILLALNIFACALVLLMSVTIADPLEFSAFAPALLVATLFRLSLDVSATRLILTQGHVPGGAGSIIPAFGDFVVRGNLVVGLIVFAILVTIQFIVIAQGSQRVAEVAARFTLDAMPGKQMAIDADLSAGLIDDKEAQRRRRELEEESAFFGSMDGASKFVRGDAVAGLIITFINVLAGIFIGVAQKNMTFTEATQTFTLLTVGDGLVSQIPALIVSTAAGMLVSKSGVAGSAASAWSQTDSAVIDSVRSSARRMKAAATSGAKSVPVRRATKALASTDCPRCICVTKVWVRVTTRTAIGIFSPRTPLGMPFPSHRSKAKARPSITPRLSPRRSARRELTSQLALAIFGPKVWPWPRKAPIALTRSTARESLPRRVKAAPITSRG